MVWAILQYFGKQGVAALVYLILTFFLTPRDFGLITLVTLIVNFLGIFNDLGFGAALVQRKEVDDRYWSTVFVLNIITGGGLALITFFTSHPIATLLEHEELAPVVACLSVSLLTNALAITQVSYRTRTMDFRFLAKRDLAASTCGGVLAIIVAASGGGVWSVVANTLTSSVITASLLWRNAGCRPQWRMFSWSCAADLWYFSGRMWVYAVLKYLVQNTDKYLINGLFGAHELGFYSVAQRVTVMPLAGFVGAVGNYIFPRFARRQDDTEVLRREYRLLLKTTVGFGVTAGVFIMFTCQQLVELVFSPEWVECAPLMRIAVLGAIAQVIISPVGQLMKAMGRPGWLVNWTVLHIVAINLALLAGSRWGLAGALGGWAVAHLLDAIISLRILSALLNVRIGWVLQSLAASLIGGLASLAFYIVAADAGLLKINLLITLAVSAFVSVLLLFPLWHDNVIRTKITGLFRRPLAQ